MDDGSTLNVPASCRNSRHARHASSQRAHLGQDTEEVLRDIGLARDRSRP